LRRGDDELDVVRVIAVADEAIVTGAPNVAAPDISRRPEVLHALTSFVENAVDFAESEVLVSARFDADSITVEVRDDGQGFDTDLAAGETHVGLRIMRERAARIGAQVELSSVPGSGTCVVLTLPDTQLLAA
jgi:nitrate/nitrite-specific signal transduction histidine kinase